MRRDDPDLIVAAYGRIRDALIGRPAEVRGRPEIAGLVIGVSLNPLGVVVVTIKARDTSRPRKPRCKGWPLRLRLPADAMIFHPRVAVAPPERKPSVRFARTVARPATHLALDHQGRLAL